MKVLHSTINKNLYYLSSSFVVLFMGLGLFIDNPLLEEITISYFLHLGLVLLLTICLFVYPKYNSHILRLIIMTVATAYFYTLFFLYPETWSTFVFLCFVPATAILFFDSKLFHYSILLNFILITLTFNYIYFIDQGQFYPHIRQDVIGNMVNFLGSQLILYLIFHLSAVRIKNQQVYYEQVQQAERFKTTSQLAAAVAHEIRNPLTVVKGFLQFYKSDKAFSNDVKRHLSLMIDELDTAEQVISQFLSTSKPTYDVEMETVDIKSGLQSVTDLLRSYGLFHDNHIELDVEDGCFISANTIEFKQLIINLIKNSIEASKEGDPVIVKAYKTKTFIEISITDYGCGMTAEQVKSLGTPFYSLKSKGTGLGLMICYNIVEKYNGSIKFKSSIDNGTSVIIRFPATI
ncbi:sensor histidine kinase [Litchfieldia salsa]|uniref:histidine kinase n=1 Tax=Litchfieldia salsa TaxID=930152 RepID=A0A1H0T6T4_9BACI|nr:HAMP domain-containing sensor histidine kinase [Litchfieldia salsa]SDP49743.1 two-component system, sporulation sensor kinase B [Litchfieldia salsa]